MSVEMLISKFLFVEVLGALAGDSTDFSHNGLVVPASNFKGDHYCICLGCAQLDGSTNTGDWVWAKMAGSDTDDDDRTGDICPDGFGNVYASWIL